MPSPKTLLTTAALGAALLVPSAAGAAEGFTAVTSDGQVAHLQSDAIPSLKPKPIEITGLAAGERLVGLDRAPSGELLALTSQGRIDDLDAATGKATAKFANPVTGAVDPNGALTFAVAPDGASARIVTAGRDVNVNLTNGAATNGPGLAFAAGDAHAGSPATPALDYGKDGRLIGVAGAQTAYVAQTAVGATTLGTLGATPFPGIEPVRSTVASDGSVWTVAVLRPTGTLSTQSRIVRYEPATGKSTGQNGVFSFFKFAAIASDGPVPNDTTKPRATFTGRTLHRKVSHGHGSWGSLRVKMNEGGQTVLSLRYRGKVVGFGLVTLDTPGEQRVQFLMRKGADATLRKAARQGRRAVVHASVHDWARNKRVYDVPVRLAVR